MDCQSPAALWLMWWAHASRGAGQQEHRTGWSFLIRRLCNPAACDVLTAALGLLPPRWIWLSLPWHLQILPSHMILEQRQNVSVSGTQGFQNQSLSRDVSPLPIPVFPLMKNSPCTDVGWSLRSVWEHSEEIWVGEYTRASLYMRLCLHSEGQWINHPQRQTLYKIVQEALVSRAITTPTHFSLVPDLLVACAGQGVSWWRCCCSRHRTTPSPGGSYQYPGNVCTQDSSKTVSHCPGLQPNYTTCPMRKKQTMFTRLQKREVKF